MDSVSSIAALLTSVIVSKYLEKAGSESGKITSQKVSYLWQKMKKELEEDTRTR